MEKELWQVLIDNGLESYVMVLEENNLDRELLSELTERDYVKIGITGEAMKKMLELFSSNYKEKVPDNTVPVVLENQVTAVEAMPVVSPVHKRLIDNGLSEYVSVFDKNKLDSFDIVSKLTENDFSELGITAIGDRKKIKSLFEIKERKTEDINNVVVTQMINSEGANNGSILGAGIIGAVLGGLIVFGLIYWYITHLVITL
ncbi:MAG: hypothetical protein LBP19_01035 [Treponema sp.]|jgi:hypothetical protein|nr:hypothetical protein [Treponema sp.]